MVASRLVALASRLMIFSLGLMIFAISSPKALDRSGE
jgi:hypothetical protein